MTDTGKGGDVDVVIDIQTKEKSEALHSFGLG
jgi:hypothetical protein